MNNLKKFLTGMIIALWFASVFALSYQRTSFSKANKPVTMPPTQFCSGTTVTGTEAIGWTCYLKVGESGANYSLVPLYDVDGNIFLTGWALSPYVTLVFLTGNYYNTGEVDLKISWLLSYKWAWDMSTGTFPHPINTWEYYIIDVAGTGWSTWYGNGDMIIANKKKSTATSSTDFDHVVNTVWPEVDPIFEANSGVYFNAHSGEYYTNNPLWYITWYSESDPIWNSVSGNYATKSYVTWLWYITWVSLPGTTWAMPMYVGNGTVTGSDVAIANNTTWLYRNPINWNFYVWYNSWRDTAKNLNFIFWYKHIYTTWKYGNYNAMLGWSSNVIWNTNGDPGINWSSIIWWNANWIKYGNYNAIIWGNTNIMCTNTNSNWCDNTLIAGGSSNTISNDGSSNAYHNNTIVWGASNTVNMWSYNGIFSSYTSRIGFWNNYNTQYNNIFGGNNNTIYLAKNGQTIIWGQNNTWWATYETIIWGQNNINLGDYSTIIWWNLNNINANAQNSYALGSWTTVTYKDTFAFNNWWAYSTTVTGSFLVNAYWGMRVGYGIFDLAWNAYLTGVAWRTYLPSTWTITRPGVTTEVPTSKAVVDYIDLASQNLGDVITTWYYYISGAVNRRIGLSGNNLSFQAYTGWAWAEKWFFTP